MQLAFLDARYDFKYRNNKIRFQESSREIGESVLPNVSSRTVIKGFDSTTMAMGWIGQTSNSAQTDKLSGSVDSVTLGFLARSSGSIAGICK